MQDSMFVLDELKRGQTASILVDDVLGSWEITRLAHGDLVLTSPEIPVDLETRVHLFQAVLLENFTDTLPMNGRFCMDEVRRLRFQLCTRDTEVDLAFRDVAQLYAKVVNPEVYRPVDEDAVIDLEQLLAEQSPEEISVEEMSSEFISQFFTLLAQDTDLANCLIIDATGTQGLIELLGGEVPILVIPDVIQKQIALYCPIALLDHQSTQVEQLEATLIANSILRIGERLMLGCIDDGSSVYLRAGVSVESLNIDSIKDTLGILISTGQSVEDLIQRVESAHYQSIPASGVLV
jgi:hypothetical protein